VGGDSLQLTGSILGTVPAINVMMRKKKLKGCAAKSIYSRGISIYYHLLFNYLSTGSDWGTSSLDLNEAESASAKR
jgi:hypothetical protein